MVTNTTGDKSDAPPYVSFRTLWNFLDRLGEIGVPPRIDRSVWGDALSGAYGFQLMAALRFLRLIDDSGKVLPPTDDRFGLRDIAGDVGDRKRWLYESLISFYDPRIQALDLSEVTMQQLQETFRESFSVTGATLDKSISFFLGAARAAEIPLSPYIEKNVRKRSTTTRPRKKKTSTKVKVTDEQPPPSGAVSEQTDKHERIVTLKSGGTVRISLDYNPFKLSQDDRTFVYDLIDKIQSYESGEVPEG